MRRVRTLSWVGWASDTHPTKVTQSTSAAINFRLPAAAASLPLGLSPMYYSPKLSSRSSGFTLIELLTVIAIIAILMALLFPALKKDPVLNAQANNDLQGVVTAVKAYVTEYGKFPEVTAPGGPAPAGGAAADALVGDDAAGIPGAPNRLLFSTLRALDADADPGFIQNPRKIPF